MIFKKNGRLYGDIESLLNECCEINQYCFQCALHGKIGTKSCAGYAAENPEEVARLLDATVIKDKPITAEAVEKHSEDEKAQADPCGHPARGGEVRMRTARAGLRHAGG